MVKIFLDAETRTGISIDEMGLTDAVIEAIGKLKNCIYQRVKLFNEEAEKQPDGYVLINLSVPRMEYFYSGELGKKMLDSITEQDFRYCMSLVEGHLILQN